jgi:hypothetical protein
MFLTGPGTVTLTRDLSFSLQNETSRLQAPYSYYLFLFHSPTWFDWNFNVPQLLCVAKPFWKKSLYHRVLYLPYSIYKIITISSRSKNLDVDYWLISRTFNSWTETKMILILQELVTTFSPPLIRNLSCCTRSTDCSSVLFCNCVLCTLGTAAHCAISIPSSRAFNWESLIWMFVVCIVLATT